MRREIVNVACNIVGSATGGWNNAEIIKMQRDIPRFLST